MHVHVSANAAKLHMLRIVIAMRKALLLVVRLFGCQN